MSYRIRFTYRDGSSGLLASEYTTRTEAEQAIAWRSNPNNCMSYMIEEVVTPEATPDDRIRELEAELAQLRDAYDAARQDLDVAMRNVARLEEALAASHQGPAKASEAPGEGGDSGEGEK